MTMSLLADCVLPGCSIPVAEVGTPCAGCLATGLVRANPTGRRMTADEIGARDERTQRAYAALALIKDPELRARIHIVARIRTLHPSEVYL